MATLYFPMEKYDKQTGEFIDACYGNLLWGTNNPQSGRRFEKALAIVRNPGLWCKPFPEGDGIVFDRGELTNTELYSLLKHAFYWLPIKPTPQNREPYYTICDVRTLAKEEVEEGAEKIELSGPDVFTGALFRVIISMNEYELLTDGVPIQKALRSVSQREREFLITGNSKEIIEEKEDWEEIAHPFGIELKDSMSTTESGASEIAPSKVEHPPWYNPNNSDDF